MHANNLLLTYLLAVGVAGMMNWVVAIAPDVLKSRLQTGVCCFLPHTQSSFN